MPKRVFDGEAWWSSQKAKCGVREIFRPFYPFIFPLATANGTFECDPAIVHWKCFAFLMPSMKVSDVAEILEEFARAGLLFRWSSGGKLWGYWVGIDKPGRLPGKSRHGKYEKAGPDPPADELAAYEHGIREIPAERKLLPEATTLSLTGEPIPIPAERRSRELAISGSELTELKEKLRDAFTERFGQKDSWALIDYRQLSDLLARKAKDGLTSEEVLRRYNNMLFSPVPFHTQQAGSLRFFCSHFDYFIELPSINGNGKNGHGKLVGDERTKSNLRAAGLIDSNVASKARGNT